MRPEYDSPAPSVASPRGVVRRAPTSSSHRISSMCLPSRLSTPPGDAIETAREALTRASLARHRDVPPNSVAQATEFVSKTKPRFCLAPDQVHGRT